MGFVLEKYSDRFASLSVAFKGEEEERFNYFETDSAEEAMKHFNLFLENYQIKYSTPSEVAMDELGVSLDDANELREALDKIGEQMSDEQALENSIFFALWKTNTNYKLNGRIRFEYEGKEYLYKCAQAHLSQTDWTPPEVPALWVRISIEEYPEWAQPAGAHDAYNIGDKVTYENKKWISIADANIWIPGVFGWEEEIPALEE